MQEGGRKTKSRLWLARRRKHLRQKQVARLLGQRSIDQVFRYETGTRVPRLEIAIKLEIVFNEPIQSLFKDLYESARNEIQSAGGVVQQELPKIGGHFWCDHSNLLAQSAPSSQELDKARTHIIELNNRVSELLNRSGPAA